MMMMPVLTISAIVLRDVNTLIFPAMIIMNVLMIHAKNKLLCKSLYIMITMLVLMMDVMLPLEYGILKLIAMILMLAQMIAVILN